MLKRLELLKSDNRGITIIEFLICFAILLGLMAIASFSLGMTPGTQAKETTQTINAMISRAKAGTLVRTGDVYMKVAVESGCVVVEYYEDGKLNEKHIVSTKDKVFVGYKVGSSTSYTEITSTKPLYLGFDRRTTGFVSLKAVEERVGITPTYSTTDFCTGIVIRGADWDSPLVEYSLTLYPTTGTHTMYGLG